LVLKSLVENLGAQTGSWCIFRFQIKGLSTQKGALLLHYRSHINGTTIHFHLILMFIIPAQSLYTRPLKHPPSS